MQTLAWDQQKTDASAHAKQKSGKKKKKKILFFLRLCSIQDLNRLLNDVHPHWGNNLLYSAYC